MTRCAVGMWCADLGYKCRLGASECVLQPRPLKVFSIYIKLFMFGAIGGTVFDVHSFVPECTFISCFGIFCQSMHDFNDVICRYENMAFVQDVTGFAVTLKWNL
jgi:hypothetical protein